MGMSASQTRLLGLTTRMHDLEYKQESLANIKLRLADESDQIAQKYTNALGKQAFSLTTYSNPQHQGQAYTFNLRVSDLNANGLRLMRKTGSNQNQNNMNLEQNNNDLQVNLRQSQPDRSAQPNTSPDVVAPPNGYEDVTSQFSNVDAYTLYEMVQSGEFCLMQTSSTNIVDVTNTTSLGLASVDSVELAKAEAEYNAATSKISRKEKEIDRQMTKLDTEHEALKTERDSLKEIIQENVDNTFKLFG